jgi:hypothetical protein
MIVFNIKNVNVVNYNINVYIILIVKIENVNFVIVDILNYFIIIYI